MGRELLLSIFWLVLTLSGAVFDGDTSDAYVSIQWWYFLVHACAFFGFFEISVVSAVAMAVAERIGALVVWSSVKLTSYFFPRVFVLQCKFSDVSHGYHRPLGCAERDERDRSLCGVLFFL